MSPDHHSHQEYTIVTTPLTNLIAVLRDVDDPGVRAPPDGAGAGRIGGAGGRPRTGVVFTDVVSGPYDVIAAVEAATMDELGPMILVSIQGVPGVVRTLTCPVVRL